MTSCTQKSSLYTIISGDDLTEFIENKCASKIIESDKSRNAFREDISWTKIKHIKYQHN